LNHCFTSDAIKANFSITSAMKYLSAMAHNDLYKVVEVAIAFSWFSVTMGKPPIVMNWGKSAMCNLAMGGIALLTWID
jgi:hypothetical protein